MGYRGFANIFVYINSNFQVQENVKSIDKIKCPETIHILHKCKEKLKLNRPIELYCYNDFESPFIFGILNPGIYIHKHILTKVDDKELAHILLHELSHYMRGDLLCNLLSTIAVILHWFNPVIWFAMKRMRSDIECACDSYVLENLEDSDSVNYGMTIIKLSSFISKSDHNKMLYAHFYESKDKIERRIVLIKRFKKGTYKLSAIAMILFIALGCFTLTNARANTDAVTALEQEGTVKEEQFNLEGEEPQKVFTTLDRAMDFIDFKFKVPDKIPADYKFSKIFLDEEKGMVSVDFDKTDDMKQICVSMLTSNNDMIKSLKEMHSKNADEKVINKRTIKPDIKFSEEPMSISDIKGTSLTVSKDWNITKEDLAEYKKHDTKQIRVRPMTKVVEKYFVWKDDNIWYSISYYYGSGDFEGFSQSEIPRDDIKILTSSLKYPKDIQNIEYKSKDYNRFLKIYGNKDLKTAKEILGFEPKFPLNLPSGFIPVSSVIYPSDSVLHDGKLIDMIRMNTIFQLKDKDSIQELWLYQTKNTSKYDDMVQNGHINWEHYEDPVDAKVKTNVGEKEIDVLPIMIDGIKVLKYELDITNTNIIAKGITKSQYYTWKQNDVVYEASFIGDMGNQEKIVKALINTP